MVFVDLTSRSTSGGRKKQQRLEKGGNSFPETDENGKKTSLWGGLEVASQKFVWENDNY